MRTHARTNSVRLGDLAHGIVAAHVAPEELWRQGPGRAGSTPRHGATTFKAGAASQGRSAGAAAGGPVFIPVG
jgi:hypothetical protein